MKNKFLLFIILIHYAGSIKAQSDTALINQLIRTIAANQITQQGEFFPGMFPAYRQCAGFPHNYQPDNNIFFTAITAFTLQNLLPHLNEANSLEAKRIIKNASKAYPFYQNLNGQPIYGFWPTGHRILPHTFFINRFTGVFSQGDDADDSVMILLAGDNNDSTNKALKERMILVSNLQKRKINSTRKQYRNYPAYSTYLGEKMHPDFDFAVHCNLLYFMLQSKLPLVKQDSATINLLAHMLKNREYMKRPVYISPFYVTSPILLYHVTRLMSAFHIEAWIPYKKQLIADAYLLLKKTNNTMEAILLRTILLRLGEQPPPLNLHSLTEFEKSDQRNFVFFQARAAFAQPTPIKQIFLHWKYLNYFFYSPAFNQVLLLEYLVLKNKQG